MAANIYKRRGVVTGRKEKNQPAQRLFVLTIFQDKFFHNSNSQSTKTSQVKLKCTFTSILLWSF